MRSIPPSVYTKEYYLRNCFGFEEFNKHFGKKIPEKSKKLFKFISIEKGYKILDIGCGRGDIVFYLASLGTKAFGIDYSKAAINLANMARKKHNKKIQNNTSFLLDNAKNLNFPDNSFDIIITVDVFEHLYPEELELVMKEISRVLKNEGILLVNTEPNKIYLDFWHQVYVYPISQLLIKINKLISKKNYPGLPKDPRNDLHKKQHVNEPTFFYLKDLFHRHKFEGKIISNTNLLKPIFSWKDRFYNIIVLWYPLCLFFPFTLLFAYEYICIMKKRRV